MPEGILPIERDLLRFKEIVRGEVKKRVREFLTREELFGQVEGRLVSIPLPQLEIPKIVHGEPLGEGLGLGGPGEEALGPGGHIPVAELELEEFLDLVGEALRLPRLRPCATPPSPARGRGGAATCAAPSRRA